jgi:hypothetical protein
MSEEAKGEIPGKNEGAPRAEHSSAVVGSFVAGLSGYSGRVGLAITPCRTHPESFAVFANRPSLPVLASCYECWRENRMSEEREARSEAVNSLLASDREGLSP